jgi:DNA-directed RNA polymerase subunit M/transcription elongation factor TFIIS
MWKLFSKHKPKKEGWYTTTVEIANQQRYTRELYWDPKKQAFWDNIRQDMFNLYTVIGVGDNVIEPDCDKTDMVIAWKKQPKPYMIGFIKVSNDPAYNIIHKCHECGSIMYKSTTMVKGIQCECFKCSKCSEILISNNEFERMERIVDALDWDAADIHLLEIIRIYRKYTSGTQSPIHTAVQLKERYDKGERSKELYDEIMKLP